MIMPAFFSVVGNLHGVSVYNLAPRVSLHAVCDTERLNEHGATKKFAYVSFSLSLSDLPLRWKDRIDVSCRIGIIPSDFSVVYILCRILHRDNLFLTGRFIISFKRFNSFNLVSLISMSVMARNNGFFLYETR